MIKLNRNNLAAFMGSMNSMPMAYAYALHKMGYPCIYFVDAPRNNTLCRPEAFFPELTYPYPAWIKEFIQRSQILVAIFPRYFANRYLKMIEKSCGRIPDCFVLNGFFVALTPYLPRTSKFVALSHGSDLDIWANLPHADHLYDSIHDRSIFRYLPRALGRRVLKAVVRRQFEAFAAADTFLYFPKGFSAKGDAVLKQLESTRVRFVPRYDISLEVVKNQLRTAERPNGLLRIFSGVRFTFRTFPDGDPQVYKGNDIIIAGLAKYFHEHNKNIQIDFVEKGEDIELAKNMCSAAGIETVVRWHKEMPFKELLQFYQDADVCFDQLGQHWIGQGMYAMALGVPLIANPSAAVRSGLWPADNPICDATNADQVCNWLVRLENSAFRAEKIVRTREFALQHFDAESTLRRIFTLDVSRETRTAESGAVTAPQTHIP